MKQVLIKKGQVLIEDVPAPMINKDSVLVQVVNSCISTGTELSALSSSGQSLLQKALKQPEKIKKAFDTVRKAGVKHTVGKVKKQSEEVIQPGYSAAGIIVEVGHNIRDFHAGDRVACAGAGIANHAEYIVVPENLVAKIPAGLSYSEASTVSLGAIAMQGVRRANISLGEYAAVIGLGSIGQITVQLLMASGIRTIGIDLDESRIKTALDLGMEYEANPKTEDIVSKVAAITNGYGVDAALLTTATDANQPLYQAFQMVRKKGKVILVGTVGMQMQRDDMYKKELDFSISTSYGPGRYDDQYELKGVQYPYAYVRWTENRNMQEYLNLISEKKITLQPLIQKEYAIEDASKAYQELKNPDQRPLIALLKYRQDKEKPIARTIATSSISKSKEGKINIAVIGAGSFAKGVHFPNLMRLKNVYNLYAISSKTSSNATSIAKKFNAQYATTDFQEILGNKDIDAVIIATRHNLHAQMAIDALKAKKAVFVEKPMALSKDELDNLVHTIEETKCPYMVGFNRRFSVYAQEAQKHIAKRINPLIINYRMNAGYIPFDNWVHTDEGGGRVIGEACHIFDLFNFFTNAKIESITSQTITPKTEQVSSQDNIVTTLKYDDGSVCTLTYTALGSTGYPKEFCEIFFDGKVITIDDYKIIQGYGVKVKPFRSNTPKKGHYEELVEFCKFIKGEQPMPIPLWQLVQASEISFNV